MDMSHRSSRFFTSTRHLCCAKLCIPLLQTQDLFAHYGHVFRTSMTSLSFTIQVIINNHAFTSDFLHGTRHTTLVRLIRTFYDENTHAVANFYNYFGDAMPSSLLKSCRSKMCRHTLLGPMERSRRGYSFTGLVHCLTDQFDGLLHLRHRQGFQHFFHLHLLHRHHHR